MTMTRHSFAWYDLMTTDIDAAKAFYSHVIGWQFTDIGTGGHPYALLSMNGTNVGGLMPIPPHLLETGTPPCWTGYILVDDVDAHTERVRAAGGRVFREPEDIPGTLRFALVGDPDGAPFIIFKGMSNPPPASLPVDHIGTIGWNELHAGDSRKAFDFYSALFGWTKVDQIDMGPLGIYQTFANGGAAIGGMMARTPGTPGPCWLYYVVVESIEAAIARAVEKGGIVIMGPHAVPTGQWIAQVRDPQGAHFAMVSFTR
jgi:predicted enzyme related to lactoylglutathione lyase